MDLDKRGKRVLIEMENCQLFPFSFSLRVFTVSVLYMIWFAVTTIWFNFRKLFKFAKQRKEFDQNKPSTTPDYNQLCLYLLLEEQWKRQVDRIRFIANLKPSNLKHMKEIIDKDFGANRKLLSKNAYVYPTISDSICDGNDIFRRIFNILTTVCAQIILMHLFFDYFNSSDSIRNSDFSFYFCGAVGVTTLIFVPLFPNDAIRMQKFFFSWPAGSDFSKDVNKRKRNNKTEIYTRERGYLPWMPFSKMLHITGIATTVFLFGYAIYHHIEGAPSYIQDLFFVFKVSFSLLAACNVIDIVVTRAQPQAWVNCFLYVTETATLLSLMLCFLFLVLSRNSQLQYCTLSANDVVKLVIHH